MRGCDFDRLSHGMCSRHETQHMPRLRLAPSRAHARFRVAVAELGVVRRFSHLRMKASRPPNLFRESAVGLRGVGFGVGRALSAPANAFCRRQRKEVSQAFSSRRGDRLSKVWLLSASLTTQAFGSVGRAPKFGRASCSGPVLLRTPTPNKALQRTAALAVSFGGAVATPTGSVTAGAPATKPCTRRAFALPRCAHTPAPRPRSLSLGSLGHFDAPFQI